MARGRPFKCPYCGSTKSISKGIRWNKSGEARIRQCKACRRRWSRRVNKNEEAPEAVPMESDQEGFHY